MSQVTDSMCKYAHNCDVNNWSCDNASNKITCSLWDTLCILEVSSELWIFFWTKSKSRFWTFFWLSVSSSERKQSLFLEKLSPGVLNSFSLSKMQCFVFFWKDAPGLESNISETFRFAPKKISWWKSLFVFQRPMFLYQLVNLVLETCFIFSKILKLSKTFLSWVSRLVWSLDQRALWFPYSRLFFGTKKMFKKVWILEYLGVYKVNCGVDIGFFWHLFSERCLNGWLVKVEIITLNFERHVDWKFNLIDWLKPVGFWKPISWLPYSDQFKIDSDGFRVWCSLIHNWITRWAPCRTIKNHYHGLCVGCRLTHVWAPCRAYRPKKGINLGK